MSQRIAATYVRVEFSQAVKRSAWARCKGRCEGCGKDLTGPSFVFDHKLPLRRGGDASIDNCQVLCDDGPDSCNAKKTYAEDIPGIAAIKRYGKNRLPLDVDRPAKKPGSIRGRGFDKSRSRKFNGEVVRR